VKNLQGFVFWSLLLCGFWPGSALASTYWVSNNFDNGTTAGYAGSIRLAVDQANGNVIAISNTLTVLAPLILTTSTIIEGRYNTINAISTGVDIFQIQSNNCVIRNLALVLSNNAITLSGSGNQVMGCRIGTDKARIKLVVIR
jgi:hypothetical protein